MKTTTIRRYLEAELRQLAQRLGGLALAFGPIDGLPTERESEFHDRAVVGEQHELDLAERVALMVRVIAIQAALERLADGTYGRCGQCDKPIGPDRLKAIPEAVLCVECATLEERIIEAKRPQHVADEESPDG